MTYDIDLSLVRSGFTLSARASGSSSRIGLYGPSGAGKTTLIRAVAGLGQAAGKVVIDDQVWQSDQPPAFVPPHRRSVGWVPQSSALLPHLDIESNLRFGPNHDSAQFDQVVSLLGLDSLLRRRPQSISGGEQKRVALGRALLARPRLLLLDEPLGGLDWPRKNELLGYLMRVLDSSRIPTIYVSHDPSEIGIFCEHVWLMESGQIIGTGTPEDIFLRPEGTSQAQLAGIENIWRGSVAELHDDLAVVTLGAQQLLVERPGAKRGDSVTVVLAAAEVLIARQRPEQTSARNIWSATIRDIQKRGREVLVHLESGSPESPLPTVALITPAALSDLALEPEDNVYVVFKATAARAF